MKTLSDLKQMFIDQVDSSHIKYGWDAGHCYSYIDHPLMGNDFENQREEDEWDEWTNEWMYNHEKLPPCDISVEGGVVRSSCGCHDNLDYIKDREEVERIIFILENFKQD